MKKKVYFIVLGLHFICLSIMTFSSPPPKKSKNHSLIVKTITPLPAKLEVKSPKKTNEKKEASSQAPLKKEKPSPPLPPKSTKPEQTTKKSALIPAKPKASPTSKPAPPKKKPSTIPQNLLRELEETIAKIDEKRDKLYSNKEKLLLEPLKSDTLPPAQSDIEELTYRENLIQTLKQSLTLPEFGEVKIELTLRRDGSVAKLKVLSAQSDQNREYLEANLSTLKFPSLVSSKEKELTFVITFCNEL